MIGEPTGPGTYRLSVLRRRLWPAENPLEVRWQLCQLSDDVLDVDLADNETLARVGLSDPSGLPLLSLPLGYDAAGMDGDDGLAPRSTVDRDRAVTALRTLVYRAIKTARWHRVPHVGLLDDVALDSGPYQLRLTMTDGRRYLVSFRELS